MASSEGEEFNRRGLFSTHGMHRLAIGGGGAGFEGTLQGSLAGGFRFPVGERHGPVIRAGIFGYLRGNDAFYASLLDLPQVQVGYQYLHGRTVILVDDGLATGSSMRAAVQAVRAHKPARVVVAVPVGAPSTCEEFADMTDETVCARMPEPFSAVGLWYRDFSQTTDAEVGALLQEHAQRFRTGRVVHE